MDIKKFIHPDLLNGGIVRPLFSFMLPLFISFLFQQFYNVVDTVIVGHYLKEASLAAIGSCSALYELMVGFGNGVALGITVVAARVFGSGNRDMLRKVVAAALVITGAITAIITVLSVFLLRPILICLGTPEQIMQEAMSYITKIGLFCGILFAYNLFSGLLSAIGNSFMPLIFLVGSSMLNITLDIFFITKLNTGVAGTAVATIISQSVSVILCMLYISRKAKMLIPSRSSFRLPKEEALPLYKDLTTQGLSMALMGSIVSLGSLILQSSINSFGTYIIAGHIAARKIFTFSTIPIFTFGRACSTFVSQNYGAGKIDRVKKGVIASIVTVSIYALAMLLILPFFVRPLIAFMSGSQNPQVLDYGTKYLWFAVPFYIVLIPLIILRHSLQSLGAKVLPLISSVLELAGKILFTALIIPRLGTLGIFLCEPLIWCVMTAYLIFAYIRRLRTL